MKAKPILASVTVMVVALLVPLAAGAQCFFVGTVADGRVLGPYGLNSASDDITLTWDTEANRSYSVEVITQRGPSGGGALSPTITIDDTFCPVADIVSAGVTIRNTTNISSAITTGGARRSVVITSPAPSFLEMRVSNSDVSTSSAVVKVSETTQFHPGWSTGGGFETFYSIQNTTNSTCTVTLKLFNLAGAEVATTTQAIAAAALLATNTQTLGVANGLAGTGRLTHDCPPGGIFVDAAIANFGTSPAAIIPAKFAPVRE